MVLLDALARDNCADTFRSVCSAQRLVLLMQQCEVLAYLFVRGRGDTFIGTLTLFILAASA